MKTITSTVSLFLFIGLNLFGQEYKITGINTGLKDSSMILLRNSDLKKPFDTAYVINNKFEFKGRVERCDLFYIRTHPFKTLSQRRIFIDEGETLIDFQNEDLLKANIIGCKIQNQSNELNLLLSDLIRKEIYLRYDRMTNFNGEANNKKEKGVVLMEKHIQIEREIRAIKEDFLAQHKDYEFCAYLLEKLKSNYSNAEVQLIFSKFDENVKQSKWGKRIKNYLDKSIDFNIGDEIIDFTLKDKEDNDIRISSFKGKYLLIDFWGSWCGPCRSEHLMFSFLYQEYNKKGFEILSVSLDSDENKWTKAIEEDEMIWVNVRDSNGFLGDIAVSYNIYSVPMNILIDKEGKIIATNIYEYRLEQKLEEILK